jgi:excisionase family DNA binding protein
MTNEELVREGLVRIDEAMEFLSVSRASLYRLIDEGSLPTVKLACSRRIPRRALIDFAATHVVEMQGEPA